MRRTFARFAVKAFGSDVFSELVTGNLAGRSARLGSAELLKAYSTSPWLRAAVNKCAADVASLTWYVCAPTKDGSAQQDRRLQLSRSYIDREKILAEYKAGDQLKTYPNHPILNLLNGGDNPYFQGFSVMELTEIFLDLVGETAWLLDRNTRNMPTTSYPIPPTWVSDLPTPSRPVYVINGPTGRREVPAEDVIWFYHPDPVNPYSRGTGIGQVLGDEIETDENAAKHTKIWFKNRALPDVLVTGEFDATEKKVMEQTWLNRLQGVAKAWLPFFLNRKVTVEKLSQTFENMQLVDLRKSERDIITQIYGVPPEVFGIIENANRATIDAADYLMKRYVTQPRAEFLRSVLQRVAMPQFDKRLVLNYINPVQEDREYELKVLQQFPWAAQLDEIRRRGGLPALGGETGKVHVISFGNQVVSELKPEPEFSGTADTATLAARASRRKGVTKASLSDKDIDKLVRAVRAQPLITRGSKVVKTTVQTFGQRAIDELSLGISFNMRDEEVTEFLANWGGDKITGEVNATTRQALKDTLAEGVDAGETTDQIAARIADVFDDAEGPRSYVIARTEIAQSSNFGAWAALDQGGVEEKEWLSTQDDVVRDTHVELDGQRVGVNAEFVSPSGARALYPGGFGVAAEDIQCRCGVLAVIPEASSSSARVQRWKALEADRRPYERQMRRAMRSGFAVQRAEVMALYDELTTDEKARVA